MSRRIELIAALVSCALGLIWLVYEVSTLQSLWSMGGLIGSGAGHAQGPPVGANGTGLYFLLMVIVIASVALGAYLHSIQQFGSGLMLLWAASVMTTIGIGVYWITPWQFVSPQFIYTLQAATYMWLTPAGVLSVVFAWIAAVAGLPIRPIRHRTVPPDDATRPVRVRGPKRVIAP